MKVKDIERDGVSEGIEVARDRLRLLELAIWPNKDNEAIIYNRSRSFDAVYAAIEAVEEALDATQAAYFNELAAARAEREEQRAREQEPATRAAPPPASTAEVLDRLKAAAEAVATRKPGLVRSIMFGLEGVAEDDDQGGADATEPAGATAEVA